MSIFTINLSNYTTMKIKNIILTGVIASMTLTTQAQVNPNGTTSDPDDSWELLNNYSDEFNSDSIDWNKWSKSTNLPSVAAWKWNNDNNVAAVTYESEQAAEITTRQNENNIPVQNTYFNSGCLQNKTQLPANFIGYVESRIYGADISATAGTNLDRRRGVCPAFWLYSDFFDSKPIGEAVYTEIDIVELQQFDFDSNGPVGEKQDFIDDAESNLHLVKKASFGRDWFRPKQPKAREQQLNKYELGFDPTEGWHTYGCEITPTKLYFYVDGVLVGRPLDNTFWSSNPLKIIASLGMRVPFVSFSGNAFTPVDPETNTRANNNLDQIPTSMHVDYIRVWEKSTQLSNDRIINDNDVFIYPNPAKNMLTIEAPSNSTISIYSINGAIVKSAKTNQLNKSELNISNLSTGLYNVQITNSGKTINKKLIIK